MRWPLKHQAAIMLACVAVGAATEPVLAQTLFGNGYGKSYSDAYIFEMTMTRIVMMALSVGSGFCIGWFLSPQAAGLRHAVMIGLACVGGAVAVFNNGMLGWSAASLISFIGFFVALGYWLGQGVNASHDVSGVEARAVIHSVDTDPGGTTAVVSVTGNNDFNGGRGFIRVGTVEKSGALVWGDTAVVEARR